MTDRNIPSSLKPSFFSILQNPATFNLAFGNNIVKDNVAAGSERVGFMLNGPACGPSTSSLFQNNTAHSSIVGIWLQSSSDSQQVGDKEICDSAVSSFLHVID